MTILKTNFLSMIFRVISFFLILNYLRSLDFESAIKSAVVNMFETKSSGMNVTVLRIERREKFVKLSRRRFWLTNRSVLPSGELLKGAHELGTRVTVEGV